jgi:effector-binding domain-containing protein
MLSRFLVIAIGLSLCFTPLLAGECEGEHAKPAGATEGEAVKQAPAPPDVSVKEVEPFTAVILPMKGSYEQHTDAITKVLQYAKGLGEACTGGPFGRYHNNPMQVKEEELLWEVGMPVAEGTEVEAPFEIQTIPGGWVAYAIHVGPYEESSKLWPGVYMWAGMNGYQPSGSAMEIWTGDPEKTGEEGPTTELRTPVTKPE